MSDDRPHGAAGDGDTDDTLALQRAIDRATSDRTSGRLQLPAGRYRCGTLQLRSHLTLELLAGAVIVASSRPADFAPVESLPYDPFADDETADQHFAVLAGDGLEAVTLVGPGTIDGNRSQRGGPKLVGLKRCTNVRVDGLRLVNSPNYAMSLLGCDRVEIAGVVVENSYSDGIDPDCCTNVHISSCSVDSFDDGICVKSSLSLGRRALTQNVIVTGCAVRSSTNCLKIGTETGSDVRDVIFSDCVLHGRPVPNASLIDAEGGGIAIEMVDGATLDGVQVSRTMLYGVPAPLFVRLGSRGRGQPGPASPGKLRNVVIRDVTATGALQTSSITGVAGAPIEGVQLLRVKIEGRGGGPAGPGLAVNEQAAAYPSVNMFGELPAHTLYCRHVVGLTMSQVEFDLDHDDPRPGLVADDVTNGSIDDVAGLRADGAAVAAWLHNARSVSLNAASSLPVERPLVRLSGPMTASVRLADWLASNPEVTEIAPDVPAGAVACIS